MKGLADRLILTYNDLGDEGTDVRARLCLYVVTKISPGMTIEEIKKEESIRRMMAERVNRELYGEITDRLNALCNLIYRDVIYQGEGESLLKLLEELLHDIEEI